MLAEQLHQIRNDFHQAIPEDFALLTFSGLTIVAGVVIAGLTVVVTVFGLAVVAGAITIAGLTVVVTVFRLAVVGSKCLRSSRT